MANSILGEYNFKDKKQNSKPLCTDFGFSLEDFGVFCGNWRVRQRQYDWNSSMPEEHHRYNEVVDPVVRTPGPHTCVVSIESISS